MNLILSVPGFFPFGYGGGQAYVLQVAGELQQRGYQVAILSSSAWNDRGGDYHIHRYEYAGIPIYSVQVNPRATRLANAYSEMGLATMSGLREAIREIQPHFIHLNGFKAALTSICREMNIPSLVTAHHPGIVCPAGTLLTPDQSICEKPAQPEMCIPCCSRQKAPNTLLGMLMGGIPRWVYQPIGMCVGQRNRAPYLARGFAYPWFVEESLRSKRLVLDQVPLIIAPSESIRKYLLLNGVEPQRIVLLPHGIKPVGRVPLDCLDGRPVRFGYMGSINLPKGFHVLIQALQQIPSNRVCELHVFGKPQHPWEKSYLDKAMGEYSGGSKVVFHGTIGNESLPEAYAQIDVLVVPSILPEAFGLVVLEAFSAGRPIIVSDSGGQKELVRQGVDGLVVQRNDSKALAVGMRRFLERPNLIVEMSAEISPVKTMREHVDQMEEIYLRLPLTIR